MNTVLASLVVSPVKAEDYPLKALSGWNRELGKKRGDVSPAYLLP